MHIKAKRQALCSFTSRTHAMEQQTSVFMPCVDVEEDQRGIENESAPLDGLCSVGTEQRDIPACARCFSQFILDDPES